jgi:hypothetical protein
MIVKTPFTYDEVLLLIELLDAATHELQAEIDHTDARRMKADLRKRLRAVQRLDERVRATLEEAPVAAG